MAKAKRFAMGGTIPVGVGAPQAPVYAGGVDHPQTTQEALTSMDAANNPVLKAKKGGYVTAADGIALRGKTRGKVL